MKTLIVTGGHGFIGSNFIRKFIDRFEIINIDCRTYAGQNNNLDDIKDHRNFTDQKMSITDSPEYVVDSHPGTGWLFFCTDFYKISTLD